MKPLRMANFKILVDMCRDGEQRRSQIKRGSIDFCFLGDVAPCCFRESSGRCVKYDKAIEAQAYRDVEVLQDAYCRRKG